MDKTDVTWRQTLKRHIQTLRDRYQTDTDKTGTDIEETDTDEIGANIEEPDTLTPNTDTDKTD